MFNPSPEDLNKSQSSSVIVSAKAEITAQPASFYYFILLIYFPPSGYFSSGYPEASLTPFYVLFLLNTVFYMSTFQQKWYLLSIRVWMIASWKLILMTTNDDISLSNSNFMSDYCPEAASFLLPEILSQVFFLFLEKDLCSHFFFTYLTICGFFTLPKFWGWRTSKSRSTRLLGN